MQSSGDETGTLEEVSWRLNLSTKTSRSRLFYEEEPGSLWFLRKNTAFEEDRRDAGPTFKRPLSSTPLSGAAALVGPLVELAFCLFLGHSIP
jgi:hypothetical protein